VLRSEPEANVAQLATSLVRGADWRAVPGLAYRASGIRANPLSIGVPDLDALPLPARDEGLPTYRGLGFATLESSRGCYHSCSFCLPCALCRTTSSSPYRQRSIASLVDEIEHLHRQGARLFLFDDEQFLPPGRIRAQRLEALGDELIRRGLDIAFTIKCRPDDVEETLFGQLKAMGLIRVYLGLESGCQTDLDLFDKRVRVAQNVGALEVLDRLGIVADFRCLMFHPWSALETIRVDIAFLESVLQLVSTALTFHEVECLPGTPLHQRLATERSQYNNAVAHAHLGARPWDYTIADTRAELLRRLARTVFRARGSGRGVPAQIVRAWYDVLLSQRFRPDQCSSTSLRTLRDAVMQLNAGTLAIWQEMLAFAQAGDICDAEIVNRQATSWASRINCLDMHISSLW
jgi:anaerobic magnesium-protoporphyrin IX monomethyl ester cyclase